MPLRKSSPKLALELLEPRIAMSGARSLGVVAGLGDSYTDEYQFYPPDRSQARNWVEILATTGKASFGALTTKVARAEPRGLGYATDWALSGATSSEMVANQVPGLARQVAGGRVKDVSILVGGNDFLVTLYNDVVNPPTSVAAAVAGIVATEATLQANLASAVQSILAANPRVDVVITTLPPPSITPVLRAEATSPANVALLAAADQAVAGYDDVIRSLAAAQPRVAVADLAAVIDPIFSPGATTESFGGPTLTLTTASDAPTSFFLADGIHPGTAAQGIIAETIVGAIDAKFGESVLPPTPTEIVSLADSIYARTNRRA